MPKPIAIQGTLVDAKNINVHKSIRLSIDVPAEMGAQIVEAFGWPTMADPVSVAVARLVPTVEAPAAKPKQRWDELPLSQQAAIRCNEPAFRRFISDAHREYTDSADEAAAYVRAYCKVKSRADITAGEQSGAWWTELDQHYQAWLRAG